MKDVALHQDLAFVLLKNIHENTEALQVNLDIDSLTLERLTMKSFFDLNYFASRAIEFLTVTINQYALANFIQEARMELDPSQVKEELSKDKSSVVFFREIFFVLHRYIACKFSSKKNTLGVKKGAMNLFSQIEFSELEYISVFSRNFIGIDIDCARLVQVLEDSHQCSETREQENQFIYNQATNIMMRKLFGMHTTEFCARREVLGLAGVGRHRPNYCNEETEILIWRTWERYQTLPDERERYLAVSKDTNQALNVVWPAINKHLSE